MSADKYPCIFSRQMEASVYLSPFQQGIVIVDSPGVGESGIMDDMVKEYLPEAFAFIYVINSVNAGGIQRDRVRESSDIGYQYL